MRSHLVQRLKALPDPGPVHVRELFRAASKRDAELFARELVITQTDLVEASDAAGSWGYSYSREFTEHRPAALPSAKEWASVSTADSEEARRAGKKFFNKVTTAFEQRRRMDVHFFERDDQWHCFFFTFNDLSSSQNHWSEGIHLHYISHLLTKQSPKDVLAALAKRKHALPSLHIPSVRE